MPMVLTNQSGLKQFHKGPFFHLLESIKYINSAKLSVTMCSVFLSPVSYGALYDIVYACYIH